MPDPRSAEFWRKEFDLLRDSVGELVMTSLLAGAEGGAQALPAGLQATIDWNSFNSRALEFVQNYDFSMIKNISDNTRRQTQKAIEEWLESGDSLAKLRQRLNPIYEGQALKGASAQRRVEMIARTETTRLFAQGNQLAWEASSTVGGKKWRTTRQDVCPICVALEGVVAPVNGLFEIPQNRMTPEVVQQLRGQAPRFENPPQPHVNCNCWTQPVVIGDEELREGTRAILEGRA